MKTLNTPLRKCTESAWNQSGGLSKPSKMPGWGWSIPAQECNVGSKLRKKAKSVCSVCYAMKLRYTMTDTIRAMYRRLNAWKSDRPGWIEAMIELLNEPRLKKQACFRWFDSGDLQGEAMLDDIKSIAAATPDIVHWVPTKEYGLTRHLDNLPSNLCVRVSAPNLDMPEFSSRFANIPTSGAITSLVHATPGGSVCPAPSQGNKCCDCRNCWDPDLKHVDYWAH